MIKLLFLPVCLLIIFQFCRAAYIKPPPQNLRGDPKSTMIGPNRV